MSRSLRALTRVLLSLLVVTLAALTAPGAAQASPVPTTSSFAPAVSKPCGIRHYPPCPPKSSFAVYPRYVHRGHRVTIRIEHYRGYSAISVHLAGYGRYMSLGSTRTGPRGNRTFDVVIPRRIHVGGYTLYVRIGSTIKAVHLTVLR